VCFLRSFLLRSRRSFRVGRFLTARFSILRRAPDSFLGLLVSSLGELAPRYSVLNFFGPGLLVVFFQLFPQVPPSFGSPDRLLPHLNGPITLSFPRCGFLSLPCCSCHGVIFFFWLIWILRRPFSRPLVFCLDVGVDLFLCRRS